MCTAPFPLKRLHSKQSFAIQVCFFLSIATLGGCGDKGSDPPPAPTPPVTNFSIVTATIGASTNSLLVYGVPVSGPLRFRFGAPLDRSTVAANALVKTTSGSRVAVNIVYESGDSVILLQPAAPLAPITRYIVEISTGLKNAAGGRLRDVASYSFVTAIDPADKAPRISDEALLDTVERRHFNYFWQGAHPVSGLALDRTGGGDITTTGGTGMGVMSIVVGIQRGWISRTEGATRIKKIVDFLSDNCTTYKGAFAHWVNGSTGATIPFSAQDNGADLVETALLMQGLITARQYFAGGDATETSIRNRVNALWQGVQWNWFRKSAENVLYWHWSPTNGFAINLKIQGWNEALIAYVLASASPTDSIPKAVYDEGWARNGAMRNGAAYYGVTLPLGPPRGGPLFFAHYSFLGIDPNGLQDAWANYETQNKAHARINYLYCVENPRGWHGYSAENWGLTASDNRSGYSAHSPDNDLGVISPTAVLASMPYTPTESMAAMRFFYYKLGDKIWRPYGFTDAFNLSDPWFATSHLAIDQGPIVVMMENHRTGLLWDLFMSAPEVKRGMRRLGFTSPRL